MSVRSQRIGEQIRSEIAKILRDEITDPRIGMLTLTRVKVSPDLSTALVFWSPLDVNGETDIDQMSLGMNSAGGFIRRQLAHNLKLRRTPELNFRYDPSIEMGSRTLALLREVRSDDAMLPDPGEEPGESGDESENEDRMKSGNGQEE